MWHGLSVCWKWMPLVLHAAQTYSLEWTFACEVHVQKKQPNVWMMCNSQPNGPASLASQKRSSFVFFGWWHFCDLVQRRQWQKLKKTLQPVTVTCFCLCANQDPWVIAASVHREKGDPLLLRALLPCAPSLLLRALLPCTPSLKTEATTAEFRLVLLWGSLTVQEWTD